MSGEKDLEQLKKEAAAKAKAAALAKKNAEDQKSDGTDDLAKQKLQPLKQTQRKRQRARNGQQESKSCCSSQSESCSISKEESTGKSRCRE